METHDIGNPGSEGDPKGTSGKKSFCHRPGCYERFTPKPQSPHQKYCSPECYKAMRRVLVREKRWRERLGSDRNNGRDESGQSSSEHLFE